MKGEGNNEKWLETNQRENCLPKKKKHTHTY